MKKILLLFVMLVGFTSLYASPPTVEKVQLNDANLLLKTSVSAGVVKNTGAAPAGGKIIISQRDTLKREWGDRGDINTIISVRNDGTPYDRELQAKASAAVVCQDGVC